MKQESFKVKITFYPEDVITAMISRDVSITLKNIRECANFIKSYYKDEYEQEGHLHEELCHAFDGEETNLSERKEGMKPSPEGKTDLFFDVPVKDLHSIMKDHGIEETEENVKKCIEHAQRYFNEEYRRNGDLDDDLGSMVDNGIENFD